MWRPQQHSTIPLAAWVGVAPEIPWEPPGNVAGPSCAYCCHFLPCHSPALPLSSLSSWSPLGALCAQPLPAEMSGPGWGHLNPEARWGGQDAMEGTLLGSHPPSSMHPSKTDSTHELPPEPAQPQGPEPPSKEADYEVRVFLCRFFSRQPSPLSGLTANIANIETFLYSQTVPAGPHSPAARPSPTAARRSTDGAATRGRAPTQRLLKGTFVFL